MRRGAARPRQLALRPAIAGGSPEADDEDRDDPGPHDQSGAGDSPSDPGQSAAGDAPSEPESAAAGGSRSQDGARATGAHPEVTAVAVLFGAASLVLGIIPSPLFDLARDAGRAVGLF